MDSLIAGFDPTAAAMWGTFAVILVALGLYMIEDVSYELTSLAVLCALLVLFQMFPVVDAFGRNLLGPAELLAGFANPALITVAALLVMGEGLARTGVLEAGAQLFYRYGRGHAALASALAFLAVIVVSGFMNNTPVVVIFIPILQALATRLGQAPSRLLMPLSFAAILGGMTTLIGSSTNLLVSGMLVELGEEGFSFFQFTVPALALAVTGGLYVMFVCPRLLPERSLLTNALAGGGRQFMAEISVTEGSKFDGLQPRGGFFPELKQMTVRLVVQDGEPFYPPFDDAFRLGEGDKIVVAATRAALTEALKGEPEHFHPETDQDWEETDTEEGVRRWRVGNQLLAEVMITPASRLVGQSLRQVGFRYRYHCMVLGMQRRSQMMRARFIDIRLEPGDVLLIQGSQRDIEALRGDSDVLLIEWTATEVPAVHHAASTLAIFLGVVGAAASGLVPIVVASMVGAGLMLATGVLNIRQAARAIDRRIVMMIAAALAMGAALNATGGARFLAEGLLASVSGAPAPVVLSAFFLFVALFTNVATNNAVAVLFTPIAVGIANAIGAPVEAFAVAVVLAASCAFISPIGYQTNLLVMAPGNYRFFDFAKAGAPLLLIVWLVFSLFAPWYYGIS